MCLALPTISFLALAIFLSVFSSATAAPIPLPLSLMAADRSLSPISVNRTIPHIAGSNLLSRPDIRSLKPRRRPMKEHARRAAASAKLSTYYNRAKANSVKLSKRVVNISGIQPHLRTASLAANSANVQDDDLDFQQDFTSQLNDFSTNMLGFQTALAQTGSDKGLLDYDKENDVEKLLKDTVDFNKNVLSAAVVTVDNIPVLGPILGPSASQCPL